MADKPSETMVMFELSEDAYKKLDTMARDERRTPEAQAEVLVLQGLKAWPAKVKPPTTTEKPEKVKPASAVTAANGTPGD